MASRDDLAGKFRALCRDWPPNGPELLNRAPVFPEAIAPFLQEYRLHIRTAGKTTFRPTRVMQKATSLANALGRVERLAQDSELAPWLADFIAGPRGGVRPDRKRVDAALASLRMLMSKALKIAALEIPARRGAPPKQARDRLFYRITRALQEADIPLKVTDEGFLDRFAARS